MTPVVEARSLDVWTGGYSGSRLSTASPALSGGSGGCRPTRWRATCSGGGGPGGEAVTASWATAVAPEEVARALFRGVVAGGESSNVFRSKGPRLYLDVGSHPEYATPECDNV